MASALAWLIVPVRPALPVPSVLLKLLVQSAPLVMPVLPVPPVQIMTHGVKSCRVVYHHPLATPNRHSWGGNRWQ